MILMHGILELEEECTQFIVVMNFTSYYNRKGVLSELLTIVLVDKILSNDLYRDFH